MTGVTTTDQQWMERALALAQNGEGAVSPNPLVGCVLVNEDKLIGEGWHRQYGGPHAEVEAVRDADRKGNGGLVKGATAYVTLEPCSHFGKTPPCADLLVNRGISKVVVCNGDPNPVVSGNGYKRMREVGILVVEGVLAERGEWINRRFFKNQREGMPYVILKWAETADGFMSYSDGSPLPITSSLANMLVHRLRAAEDGILIGANTAKKDNPSLNVRKWAGKNPVRIVLDSKKEKLSHDLKLFTDQQQTILITTHPQWGQLSEAVKKISIDSNQIEQWLKDLFANGIKSILVEGGAAVHKTFLKAHLWDEAQVFSSNFNLYKGIKAPSIEGALIRSDHIGPDFLRIYAPLKKLN